MGLIFAALLGGCALWGLVAHCYPFLCNPAGILNRRMLLKHQHGDMPRITVQQTTQQHEH
jgi:hypothetical protein